MSQNEGEDPPNDEQPKDTKEETSSIDFLLKSHSIGKLTINYRASEASQAEFPEERPEDLPRSLPPNLHPFRDPRHSQLVRDIEDRRVILLASYQESAAFAAAYSLVHDEHFCGQKKRALFPTRKQKDISDLDFVALTEDELLGREPQIVLIEIDARCTLLDSVLALRWGVASKVHDQLQSCRSYLILALNEDLLNDEATAARARNLFPFYLISHLRYLLARDFADRAEELEKRLLSCLERGAGAMDVRELYQRVADRLADGVPAFEEFVRELEHTAVLPIAARKQRYQPVEPQNVFREESELHCAAAFVATYFPNIGQSDFAHLLLRLIGNEMAWVERSRQLIAHDGTVTTIRDDTQEHLSARWPREADRVFRDCHLRPVVSPDGSWVIDFSEPYLRRELRAHLEQNFWWYLKRQCQTLQDVGALFALDLSTAAVKGLVRLFVDRAIADPSAFGSVWLLDLVRGLKVPLKGEPPSTSPAATLVWLLEKLSTEARLLAHFHARLALLIREMLDREALRPMVDEFFEFLIASKQHNALLNVVLDLARRLRFAPHFDPLAWMRRLLDQGSEAVRERTAERLIALARGSGPRIYEFLATIRSWLPDASRSPERFSLSNRVALQFPFAYSLAIAGSFPSERCGAWPSFHPLFYALPTDPADARNEIVKLVEWALDPRGAASEKADTPGATGESVHIGRVADLVEHWSWVLEGGVDNGPPEPRQLFTLILEEIGRRIGARERSWFQRSWQRSQDDYLRQAANASGARREMLVRRRARLDQLRMRFAKLEMPRTTGGVAP